MNTALNRTQSLQDRLYGAFEQEMDRTGSISINSSILREEPYGNYGLNMIICMCCGEFKEVSKFNIDRSNKRGYNKFCKLCRSIGRQKDMPKVIKLCSECNAEIKNRGSSAATCSLKCAGIRADKKAKGDQFLIFNRDGCRCQYCGRTPSEDDIKIVCDHIKPKIEGGEDTADNLVTCCAGCNSAKSDKKLLPETFELISKSVADKNKKFGINPKKIITGSHSRHVVPRCDEQKN
ncbi:MAG: HNH endonuclease [Caulobacteraceae bacterium]|nr:HNH endonuclease [Caulobacteraceae bacterium]